LPDKNGYNDLHMKFLMFSLLCGVLMVSTLSQGQNSGRQDRNKGNKDYQTNQADSTGSDKGAKKDRHHKRSQKSKERDSMSGTVTDTATDRNAR
jgi:hypothetical protein